MNVIKKEKNSNKKLPAPRCICINARCVFQLLLRHETELWYHCPFICGRNILKHVQLEDILSFHSTWINNAPAVIEGSWMSSSFFSPYHSLMCTTHPLQCHPLSKYGLQRPHCSQWAPQEWTSCWPIVPAGACYWLCLLKHQTHT